jgi:hypothetical protein
VKYPSFEQKPSIRMEGFVSPYAPQEEQFPENEKTAVICGFFVQ